MLPQAVGVGGSTRRTRDGWGRARKQGCRTFLRFFETQGPRVSGRVERRFGGEMRPRRRDRGSETGAGGTEGGTRAAGED